MTSKYTQCPCDKKQLYHRCCGRFHNGELPSTALDLMRSRYSAFVMDLPDYIMSTTHPDNEQYASGAAERDKWKSEIEQFSRGTTFLFLQVDEFTDGAETAFVTFLVNMRWNNQDASFKERSEFAKVDGRWLYKSGAVDSNVTSPE